MGIIDSLHSCIDNLHGIGHPMFDFVLRSTLLQINACERYYSFKSRSSPWIDNLEGSIQVHREPSTITFVATLARDSLHDSLA